ncbi:UNVERIFIED_CONTAM: hypothetical protein GTU68_051622 [Idotea baltica]|nr:hypothetical protein [Idotea baltica]
MKTMGLTKLVLVNPRKFPHVEASARAAGADDVLEGAQVVSQVSEAIADRTLVLGTSVRDRQVSWPTVNPKQAAQVMLSHIEELPLDHKVAILFGRENSGLSNEELDLCQQQINIPANEDYSSLNLASAVQIIMYELRMRSLCLTQDDKPLEKRRQRATKAQLEGHFQHLEDTLDKLDFIKSGPSTILMRKLTRLYNKAELTVEEIQILRGILAAMQDHLPQQN